MSFMVIIAAFATLAFTTSAEARHHHRQHITRAAPQASYNCVYDNSGRNICLGGIQAPLGHPAAYDASGNYGVSIIGGRPDGCPHRYCGCGLRKYLGINDVRLNLAWNWALMFPHEASPRPGVAAVRHGHVMYIEASTGGGNWLIRDYNSGGGLSRLHVRDVRGYVFVNPRGRMAGQ